MPRRRPVLSLLVTPQFRKLRGERRLVAMAKATDITASLLSQLERGERLPRPQDLDGLERGYGPQEGWYVVTLYEGTQ